jgi:transposase InsO family protein
MGFVDEHAGTYGVEPICCELAIAPSTCHDHVVRRIDPARRSNRSKRDEALRMEIKRVYAENRQAYGARKVWHQLRREGFKVARCTVERLMREMGLKGVVRGKTTITTIADKSAPCPLDKVNRAFKADRPNKLWAKLAKVPAACKAIGKPAKGVDFTYVHTYVGFVYVAFVIDAFARRVVGWKVSGRPTAEFVLDALEQAIATRRPHRCDGLVHHSDRGSQYTAMTYTERLAEAGLVPSVGSVGDSYDNALAETINGLFKAEVIHRRKAWKSLPVEWETCKWVDWFNNRRLLSSIGYITPAEAEAKHYAAKNDYAMAA